MALKHGPAAAVLVPRPARPRGPEGSLPWLTVLVRELTVTDAQGSAGRGRRNLEELE